jgi:VanZ family protein
VPRLESFLRYWVPAILWMILIFSGSTNLLSSSHTSRFIGPFLRWLKPDISEEAIARVQTVVRKGGHLTEYAVLGFLFWRGCRKPMRNDRRGWDWRHAGAAFALAAAYSASDEIHQAFVPSREARVTDVLIDVVGASLGLFAVWFWGRWRGRW